MRFPYINYMGRYLPIVPVELRRGEEWVVFDIHSQNRFLTSIRDRLQYIGAGRHF